MKKYFWGLLLTLAASSGLAQTKGFINVLTSSKATTSRNDAYASRCLQFDGNGKDLRNCLKFGEYSAFKFNQVYPLTPGIYKLELTSDAPEVSVEITLGQLTEVRVKSFGFSDFVKAIPNLTYYKNDRSYKIRIARDYRDSRTRLQTDLERRKVIGEWIYDRAKEVFCNPTIPVTELLRRGRVEICEGGKKYLVPFKIQPDLSDWWEKFNADPRNGIYIDTYFETGLVALQTFVVEYDRDDKTNKISRFYARAWNGGPYNALIDTSENNRIALLPGQYAIYVTAEETYDVSNPIDVFYFEVN